LQLLILHKAMAAENFVLVIKTINWQQRPEMPCSTATTAANLEQIISKLTINWGNGNSISNMSETVMQGDGNNAMEQQWWNNCCCFAMNDSNRRKAETANC